MGLRKALTLKAFYFTLGCAYIKDKDKDKDKESLI